MNTLQYLCAGMYQVGTTKQTIILSPIRFYQEKKYPIYYYIYFIFVRKSYYNDTPCHHAPDTRY